MDNIHGQQSAVWSIRSAGPSLPSIGGIPPYPRGIGPPAE